MTPDMLWLRRFGRALLLSMRMIGEPLQTPLPSEGIAGLLRNEGFGVEHDSDTRDWWRQLCPPGSRKPLIVYERLVSARKG